MREIKFRALDKKSKKMQYDAINSVCKITCPSYLNHAIKHFQTEFELMQFTGLHDKNGKEIYEGDIVEGVGKLGTLFDGEIKYNGNACAFLLKGCLDFTGLNGLEIIGNIYENPELIETKL